MTEPDPSYEPVDLAEEANDLMADLLGQAATILGKEVVE